MFSFYMQVGFVNDWVTWYFVFMALMTGLCIYQGLKTNLSAASIPFIFICLNIAIFIFWWRTGYIWPDEVEHLHCGWLVSQGQVPFKDFWQHHPPLVWILIAPFISLLKPSAAIFEYSRIFCIFLFLLCSLVGWKITVRVWKKKANATFYLLTLSAALINGEWLYLRPDLFMTLFCLLGIYFGVAALEGEILPLFLSGASFSLGLSFLPKQYLIILLPLFFLLKDKNKLLKAGIYFLGLGAGLFPLFFYLLKTNTLREFLFWVFAFNGKRVTFEASFPITILTFTVLAVITSLRNLQETKSKAVTFLFAALFLVTLNCLPTGIFFSRGYYLQLWFILCAAICSSFSINNILNEIKSSLNRAIVLTVIGMLFIMPNFYVLGVDSTTFKEDKEAMEKMLRYSQGATCFALAPWHPIFVQDATWMYLVWQFNEFAGKYGEINSDMKRKGGLIDVIIKNKPPIIQATSDRGMIFATLKKRGVISASEFETVKAFLIKYYTFESISDVFFFVRKDKADSLPRP